MLLTRNHPSRIATSCRYSCTAESSQITDSDGTVTQVCFPKAGRISAEGTVTSEMRIVEISWIISSGRYATLCMELDISSRWLNGSLCIRFQLECVLLYSTVFLVVNDSCTNVLVITVYRYNRTVIMHSFIVAMYLSAVCCSPCAVTCSIKCSVLRVSFSCCKLIHVWLCVSC